jgi:adenosylmethionine-8-amino-7-oxononanoate aminotransferase
MSPVVLKKKESRLLWQLLIRGIVVTDRMNKRRGAEDQDDYSALRQKVIAAWKAGIIVGGVRPKSHVRDIMPPYILQQTELARFNKATKKHRRASQERIEVPHKNNDK